MKSAKEKYADYLQTDYWKAVEREVKSRAGYRCQICNSQHDLQAHHRTYEHRGRELEFLSDLTCLCRRCHGIFHGILPMPVPAQIAPKQSKRERRIARLHKREQDRLANTINASADMPPGAGDITLTWELVQNCRTAANGFTNATLRALGVKAPLERGWTRLIAGRVITREAYQQALEGRTIFNSGML